MVRWGFPCGVEYELFLAVSYVPEYGSTFEFVCWLFREFEKSGMSRNMNLISTYFYDLKCDTVEP